MTLQKHSPKILIGIVFLISSTAPAYAYLDPGTATIILQGLIGAVAGGLIYARLYWDKIKSFFNGTRNETVIDQEASEGAEATSNGDEKNE